MKIEKQFTWRLDRLLQVESDRLTLQAERTYAA